MYVKHFLISYLYFFVFYRYNYMIDAYLNLFKSVH